MFAAFTHALITDIIEALSKYSLELSLVIIVAMMCSQVHLQSMKKLEQKSAHQEINQESIKKTVLGKEMAKELPLDDVLACNSRQTPIITAKQTRRPGKKAKKQRIGAEKASRDVMVHIRPPTVTEPVPPENESAVVTSAFTGVETSELFTTGPSSIDSAAVKIQASWKKTLERKRRRREMQYDTILGMCNVGSRLAEIFLAEALECDDGQKCVALGCHSFTDVETSDLFTTCPSSIDSAAVKIQASWKKALERRRRRREMQYDRILGMCNVGSRLAKIFLVEALECDDAQECVGLELTNESTCHSEIGFRLGEIFKEELEGGQVEQPIWNEPVKVQGHATESRSAKTLITELPEYNELDRVSQTQLFQPSQGRQGKRAASPDSSTSAGTTSESEEESASEWMAQEVWRPPPSLAGLFRPPPGLELEIPEP